MSHQPGLFGDEQPHQLAPGFNAWWLAYPRKIAKADALKAWAGLSPGDRVVLVENSPAWVAELLEREPKFQPYPASFIRRGAWHEPPPKAPAPEHPSHGYVPLRWADEISEDAPPSDFELGSARLLEIRETLLRRVGRRVVDVETDLV